jgi:hypothetical protein
VTSWHSTLTSQPERLRGYAMPCGRIGATFADENSIPGTWRR